MRRIHRGYWIPNYAWQLREELRKARITRVSGQALARVRKRQLYAVFFRLREQQRKGERDGTVRGEFAARANVGV